MNKKSKIVEEKSKQLKEFVGSSLSLEQCEFFIDSTIRDVITAYENYTSEIVIGKVNDRNTKSLVDQFLNNYLV